MRGREATGNTWAGGADAEGQAEHLAVLRRLVEALFPFGRPGDDFQRQRIAEDSARTVYLHAHMDEDTFDCSRAMLCPDLVPAEPGRLIPACTYNLFYRMQDERFFTANPRAAAEVADHRPACLVSAGRPWAMTRAEFARMLERLIAAERQIDILNLSGGEPLLHPQVLELIDEALSRPEIVRVSVSTNGLALLREPGLLEQLQERHVVVSLQFDGFDPRAYEQLRGRPLLAEKRALLDRLRTCGTTTSLTMTVAGGVNDDQFPAVLDYFFAQRWVAVKRRVS